MKILLLILSICLLCGCSSSECIPIKERNLPELVNYEIIEYPKNYNYDEACYNVKSKKEAESKLYLDFERITNDDGNQMIPLIHETTHNNQATEKVIEELKVNIHHIQIPESCINSSATLVSKHQDIPFELTLGNYFEKFDTARVHVDYVSKDYLYIVISFADCEKDESNINPLECNSFAMRLFTTQYYEELKYKLDNNMWDGIFPHIITKTDNLVLGFNGELSDTVNLPIQGATTKYEKEYLEFMSDFNNAESKNNFFNDKIILVEQ